MKKTFLAALAALSMTCAFAQEDYNLNKVTPGIDDMAWTWWFGPQVVSVDHIRTKLWWGYTDSQGYAGVAEYDPTTAMFRKNALKKNGEFDDHNNSVVVTLPDGRVGCIYAHGHETGPYIYIRTSKVVESIDEFSEPAIIKYDGTTTYIQYFFVAGKHYIFTRYKNGTYRWAYVCSEDFEHWSEPRDFISATDTRYYIKLQSVTDNPDIIRITAYGHPTEGTDSNIRMGFINLADGYIYDGDFKTRISALGESFVYTDLSVAIPHPEKQVQRLFDVARTPTAEYCVAFATFSPIVKYDSQYHIFKNGTTYDLCKGGEPFWLKSVYLGGISFIDAGRVVLSRNTGNDDNIELWDWQKSNWKCSKTISSESTGPEHSFRNIRPIVDVNGKYLLWQRGYYNQKKHGFEYQLEARIYDIANDRIVK